MVFPELAIKEDRSFVASEVKEMLSKLRSMLGRSTMSEIELELNALFKGMEKLRSPEDIHFAIRFLIIQLYSAIMESAESGGVLSDLDDIFKVIKAESILYRIKDLVKQIFFQIHKKLLMYQQDHLQDPL